MGGKDSTPSAALLDESDCEPEVESFRDPLNHHQRSARSARRLRNPGTIRSARSLEDSGSWIEVPGRTDAEVEAAEIRRKVVPNRRPRCRGVAEEAAATHVAEAPVRVIPQSVHRSRPDRIVASSPVLAPLSHIPKHVVKAERVRGEATNWRVESVPVAPLLAIRETTPTALLEGPVEQ